MRRDASLIIILVISLLWFFFYFMTQSRQQFSHNEWALVDKDDILKTLPAIKNIRKFLEEHLHSCQKKLMEKEDSLRKDYQDVLERSKEGPQDYEQARMLEEKRKVFKDTILDAQREADGVRHKTRDAFDRAMKIINDKFEEIIAQLAKENQLECVLDKKNAFYVTSGRDLTHIAFELLNEKTKDIALEVEK